MCVKYNINIIYQFLSLILFLLTIWFIDNVCILTLVYILLFILNYKVNPLLLFMCFLTLFFVVLAFNFNTGKVLNMMLIVDYIILFVINIKKDDLIFLKRVLKKKKYTYKMLAKEYKDIKNINENNFNEFVYENKIDNEKIEYIKDRLNDKNNSDIYNKLCVNYLRFYKNQNDNYKYGGLNKFSLIYLGICVIMLVVSVVM